MKRQKVAAFPLRPWQHLTDADRKIADLAFELWLARNFRGGSPEDLLLTAIRKLSGEDQPRLFLVTLNESPRRVDRRRAEMLRLRGGSQ